jgi:hypothetical protein
VGSADCFYGSEWGERGEGRSFLVDYLLTLARKLDFQANPFRSRYDDATRQLAIAKRVITKGIVHDAK